MEFIPCAYTGQRTADGRRFDGLGRYTFANGDVYIGGMQDGQFHGQGVIFFRSPGASSNAASAGNAVSGTTVPGGHTDQGETEDDALKAFLSPSAVTSSSPTPAAASESWSGQYRGVWEHGRHVEGQHVFEDGLIYGNENADPTRFTAGQWTYCHGSDSRLWGEYLENVAPVLPHEALLGGARLLHERKHAAASFGGPVSGVSTGAVNQEGEGEGLPMVLPNAFVQARAAPAFASGQLGGVRDPRVMRWTAAAAADEAAKRFAAASPEMIESTIALQLALAHSTAELRTRDRSKNEDEASGAVELKQDSGPSEGNAQRKLNLTVCRVKDVEDVSRELVQVVPAPS